MEDLHAHCLNCVNRRCMTRPETGVSCDLIGCHLVCGAVFHACKAEEHCLLCPLERVPCLNCGFGCPFTIPRTKMAEHLETCPASVVCCTMEWNRWPVSYSDRQSYENLSKDFDEVEQLDMALALQDQRMLLESLRVTTTVSKNGDIKPVEDIDKMALVSSAPETVVSNGMVEMEEETYGELYSASVETSRSLVAALDILSNAKEIDLIIGNLSGGKSERNGVLRNGGNGHSDSDCYVDVEDLKNVDMRESDSESDGELGAVGGVDSATVTVKGIDVSTWVEPAKLIQCLDDGGLEEEEKDYVMGLVDGPLCNGFHNGNDHNHLRRDKIELERGENRRHRINGSSELNSSPGLNGSYEIRPQMPYHSMSVVAREPSRPRPSRPHPPPLPPHIPIPLPDLVPNNVLQHLPLDLEDRWLERKLQNLQVLRGMSLFTFNGRRALLSDPYLFRAKMEDKAVDTSDLEVTEDPMGLHGIDVITAALLFCLGDSPGGRGISDSRFVDGYRIDFGTQTFSFPSAILATNTMVGDIASASACDHASPQLSNPSPFHTLRLDLVLECVARYQTKQRSMFTFVCGQLFRRDEFSSHFKNVHGDIHAGLNGWMEHRCPLAYYGCTYSQRRFCPSVQGSRIIHDRHLGAFGVQADLFSVQRNDLPRNTCRFGSQCDHLSSLPFELLQYVARFLDGFSLCQLSRVSRTMREVCSSLLQVRGMVVLLWNKERRADGSSSWQINNKVWRFSTSFGTVNEWKFANISSMADHLKRCQFNTVARREEAVPLPCMCFTRELTKEGRSLRSVLKPVA